MRSLLVAGVALTVAVGAACGDTQDEQPSRPAQLYIATVREIVAGQPAPVDPEILPIVYVMAVGESPIDAGVQAEVAAALLDEAVLRFADVRSEAVLEDVGLMPVRDEGVLLAVGELAREGQPLEVEVEIYRSVGDSSKAVLTLAERSSEWTVTSSSVVPDP
ncbi:MAG: hypothetical protein ACR2HQ_04860 [Ilumatobacteraceae bacterium]